MSSDKNLEYISQTQTLIGTKQRSLVDTETGEQILVDQITKRVYGTKNFWKCYLIDFLQVLGILDSKQCDVFIYIVENTNPTNNVFLGTYKKIARDVGVTEATISKIMKKLKDHNFVKMIQNGAYLVNPNVLMKGNDTKRQILLSYYESDTPIDAISYTRTKKVKHNDDENLTAELESVRYQLSHGAALSDEERQALKDRKKELRALLESGATDEEN